MNQIKSKFYCHVMMSLAYLYRILLAPKFDVLSKCSSCEGLEFFNAPKIEVLLLSLKYISLVFMSKLVSCPSFTNRLQENVMINSTWWWRLLLFCFCCTFLSFLLLFFIFFLLPPFFPTSFSFSFSFSRSLRASANLFASSSCSA